MKLLEIDLILFDLDGVLIDSSDDISESVNITLREFGFEKIPKNEIVSFLGYGPKDLIDRSFGDQNNMLKINAFKFYKNYYYNNCTINTSLFENVKLFLEKTVSKKKAVITNKLENPSRKILDSLGIVEYFDDIIGPDSIANLKPDPEGILKVINRLSIAKNRTIMIGDSDVDIIAGKNAGIYTCGIRNRFGDQDKLVRSEPDFLIDDLMELLDFIN